MTDNAPRSQRCAPILSVVPALVFVFVGCSGGPRAMDSETQDSIVTTAGAGAGSSRDVAEGGAPETAEAAGGSRTAVPGGAPGAAALDASFQGDTQGVGGAGESPGNVGSAGKGVVAPSATPEGTSPYATLCRGETRDCGDPALRCLGVGISESGAGYACSNRCESDANCADAPSGTGAEAGCVQLTEAKHCLLVCHLEGEDFACPADMSCFLYPGSYVGYCLYL